MITNQTENELSVYLLHSVYEGGEIFPLGRFPFDAKLTNLINEIMQKKGISDFYFQIEVDNRFIKGCCEKKFHCSELNAMLTGEGSNSSPMLILKLIEKIRDRNLCMVEAIRNAAAILRCKRRFMHGIENMWYVAQVLKNFSVTFEEPLFMSSIEVTFNPYIKWSYLSRDLIQGSELKSLPDKILKVVKTFLFIISVKEFSDYMLSFVDQLNEGVECRYRY